MTDEYYANVRVGDIEVGVSGPDPSICTGQAKRGARQLYAELFEIDAEYARLGWL